MARQTDYALSDLQEMLKESLSSLGRQVPGTLCPGLPSGLPAGLVCNEIGQIFLEAGDDQKKTAEAELLRLLQGGNDGLRSVAYFYLTRRDRAGLNSETREKIAAFEDEAKNADIIRSVRARQEALDA